MYDLKDNRPEVIGLWAGTLAVTEVGLGSVMHGLLLPLTCAMLSCLLVSLALLVESNLVAAFWIGLRSFAVAYITYFLLWMLPWQTLLNGNSTSQRALRTAISRLHGMNSNIATAPSRSVTEADA